MIEDLVQRIGTCEEWRQAPDRTAAVALLAERFARVEPRIRAFVPDTVSFERLRRELGRRPPTGDEAADWNPLSGVPIGVKDIFHVEGMKTRAGSRLPSAALQGIEADCVRLLLRAGGTVLGKTATTEFAYFAPGPTRNPHDPERTPGGSSSGSAAAVAAGLCPLALGTQTIGSISRPASFCGVVGFKATFGRIPIGGVIPLAPSLDHLGTFTVDVADATRVAAILCQGWKTPVGAARPILAIPEGPYLDQASDEGRAHFRSACERLTRAGFEARPVPAFTDFESIVERHRLIVAAEAARVHSVWYPRFRDLYHDKTRELIERGQQVPDEDLAGALPGRQRLREELETLMERHRVDLWVSPAACGPAPVGLQSTGDPIMNLPWTHAGVPTLSLPAGKTASGLPMGLQLAASYGADELLLAWGALLEEALGADV